MRPWHIVHRLRAYRLFSRCILRIFALNCFKLNCFTLNGTNGAMSSMFARSGSSL